MSLVVKTVFNQWFPSLKKVATHSNYVKLR